MSKEHNIKRDIKTTTLNIGSILKCLPKFHIIALFVVNVSRNNNIVLRENQLNTTLKILKVSSLIYQIINNNLMSIKLNYELRVWKCNFVFY